MAVQVGFIIVRVIDFIVIDKAEGSWAHNPVSEDKVDDSRDGNGFVDGYIIFVVTKVAMLYD